MKVVRSSIKARTEARTEAIETYRYLKIERLFVDEISPERESSTDGQRQPESYADKK